MTEQSLNMIGPLGCQSEAAAAYLDGELDDAAAAEFEGHAKACRLCATALSEQRRLLCMLDGAFTNEAPREFALPANFTQVITARAQTDMRSVRLPSEKKRALALSLLLAAVSFALLGISDFGSALAPVRVVWQALAKALDVAAYTVFETLTGAALILRAIGGLFIPESGSPRLLLYGLFALASVLLFRLIVKYRRRTDLSD